MGVDVDMGGVEGEEEEEGMGEVGGRGQEMGKLGKEKRMRKREEKKSMRNGGEGGGGGTK